MDLFCNAAQYTADTTLSVQKSLWSYVGITPSEEIANKATNSSVQIHPSCCSRLFGFETNMLSLRLAGVSGATAVMLSAYGAHKVLMDSAIDARRKKAIENGNKYQFYHTIALFLANKSRYPAITTALFAGGIVFFCGPCYAYGFCDYEQIRNFTPIGGIMFILGWLSFLL